MKLSLILNKANHLSQKALITFGLILILVSCSLILMGLLGIFSLELFAFRFSSGIRTLASVAITGCIAGTFGCWIKESA